MKKILKRLLISTALITPIAISTPLLLTSCSNQTEPVQQGPSIFKQSYGPLELHEADMQTDSPKGYYLETTISNDSINNEIFQKILNIVPVSPKFVDLATPVSAAFGLDLKEVQTPQLPTEPNDPASGILENKINYSEFAVKNQELSANGKSDAILKIFKNFVFESFDKKGEIISFYPSSAFDLEKYKNDIQYDVDYTVRQGSVIVNSEVSKYTVVSDISFTFKLKDSTKKWEGLNTGDPIFVTITWTEDSKSTLFNKGFTLTPDSTDNVINFTGTLDKTVFGDKASSIDKTEKVKQWFEGVENLNGSGDNSYGNANLTEANKKIGEKLPSIFEKISSELTNPGVQSQGKNKKPVNFAKGDLTTAFITGISSQYKHVNKAAPPTGLGKANIIPSIQSITKDTEKKKFIIELQFNLVNDNEPGWYGLNDATSRLPIKFTLDVTI